MRSTFSHSKTQSPSLPFIHLCKSGILPSVSDFLSTSPSSLNEQDSRSGSSPLSIAVLNSKLEIVRFLLDQGADPNLQDLVGESPLHLAAENSCMEIAELLLRSKAEPNCTTIDGETPLHHAAFKGDLRILALLLSYGADPNSADVTLGRTPLHCAVQCGHLEGVNLLLSYGGNPTIEDKEGSTAVAACQSHEISKVLAEWDEKRTRNRLNSIPEAGASEEEKNSFNYSETQSLASVNFSIADSSFESVRSELLPTLKFGNEDTTASFLVVKTAEDLRLEKFLNSINLLAYRDVLVREGFDDLEMMTYQMICPLPITHGLLESIGIAKHGHRSRLMMKLEQNAGISVIGRIEERSSIDSAWECCNPTKVNPPGVNSLADWLSLIKLEAYVKAFEQAGYEDLGFMHSQMNSRYPIDDALLQKIGVGRLGHRLRILGKLLEDSQSSYVKPKRTKESCILL